MPDFDIATLLAAIFGGSVVGGIRKLLDWRTAQQEQEHSLDKAMRDELREDVRDIRQTNDQLAEEIRELRSRNQKLSTIVAELKSALVVYQQQHRFLYARLTEVITQLNEYKKAAGEKTIDVENWLPDRELLEIYEFDIRPEE